MPYGSKPLDPTDPGNVWTHDSPASSIQTPIGVEIRSPEITNTHLSVAEVSPQDQVLLTPLVRHQRSSMLVQGHLHDVLRTMSSSEQM